MCLSLRYFRNIGLLGVLFALMGAEPVCAGWMGFRNDTKETIVIQETITVGAQQKPGKPVRLFVGEAVRDTQCAGAQRKISIFNTKNPNVPLHSANFPCPAANENILYIIKSDGNGGISIETHKASAKSLPPKK